MNKEIKTNANGKQLIKLLEEASGILSPIKEIKLTPKQSMFIKEYLIDMNATQAAIRSGYSEKTAFVIGNENLNKPYIKEEIDKALALREKKLDITADYILGNIKKIGERCMQEEPVMKFDSDIKQMVETGEYKFDSSGALKAMELLGKNQKLFTDKVESTNANTEISYEEYLKRVNDTDEY